MPSWGQILREFQDSGRARGDEGPDSDGIRLRYIRRLNELSGHAVIVYASAWLKSSDTNLAYSVEGADVHALMEVCHEVPERRLDLILHSPGGFPQAAEQMLNYLRTQFDYIRALVPLQAKSAATMLALGADEIVMGRHSELGPIDPQIIVPVPEGSRPAPAHAILRDFQRAKDEIATDTGKLPAWTPILRGYAGGLIDFCSQQIALSQEVVAGWLEEHMLSHDDAGIPAGEREEVAKGIAGYFGSEDSYDRFRTHSRPIRVEELEGIRGLRVRRLEQDDDLQDAVLSIYQALDLTFSGPAIKIVENHVGARYVRIQHQIIVQGGPAVTPTPAVPPSKPKPQGNRAERRRQQRAR